MKKLAKLETIQWLESDDKVPMSSAALVGNLEILVPMAGLIDQEAELAKLAKDVEKSEKEISRLKGKLNNASFVAKAPADVVAKEQEKLQALEQALLKIQEQEQRIRQL